MKPLSKTIWIILFAIAMGYLETSVVVYLRALYYPEGFIFPMKEMAYSLAVTEIFREAATIIMILAVSVLAAKLWLHRFAWFLVVFAIWDLMYYVFLKVLVGWPESFFTTDILFLLPSMWTGPVIAPVINSLTMIALGMAILFQRKGFMPVSQLSRGVWSFLIIGSLLILIAYMKDFAGYAIDYRQLNPSDENSWDQLLIRLSPQFMPGSFDWLLFCSGVLMHFAAVFLVIFKKRTISC